MPSDEFASVEYAPDGDELALLRDEHEHFKTLPPERQAYELNRCSDAMESSTQFIVVDGEATAEGSVHADLLKQRRAYRQRREGAIAWRRVRLAGIAAPLIRRLDCGRAPRSQRTCTGSAGGRSRDRPRLADDDEPDPVADREAAA